MADNDTWEKLKANPTVLVSIVVAIIGVIVFAWANQANKGKAYKYAGGAFAVGGLVTAIGAWAYGEYKAKQDDTTTVATNYGAGYNAEGYVPGL